MPVQAEDAGVVLQMAVAGVDDGAGQRPYELAGNGKPNGGSMRSGTSRTSASAAAGYDEPARDL
ncbi:hypothetical protein [Nonomuraea wenchangensis]|uniref:hypothetical protein n=1 Tax=Nonomuraea wenchangensis TaxID=568860 RepID=UPI0033D61276